MSLGKTSSKSSSTQSLAQNPNQDVLAANATNIAGWAGQPAPAYDGPGLDLSGAIGSARDLSGFNAPSISAAQMSRGNIRDVDAGSIGAADISRFMDPYLGQVVDATRGDMEYARQVSQNQNKGMVAQRGAFGNSRRGIYEAEIDSASQRNQGAILGNLRSQGFGQALGAAQVEKARSLQAQLANQGVDVTVEQANAMLQQQTNEANQRASIDSAGVRTQATGMMGQLQQAQTGFAYDDFVRQRQEELQRKQLQNQAYGMLYSGPMTTATSKSSGFNIDGSKAAAAIMGG